MKFIYLTIFIALISCSKEDIELKTYPTCTDPISLNYDPNAKDTCNDCCQYDVQYLITGNIDSTVILYGVEGGWSGWSGDLIGTKLNFSSRINNLSKVYLEIYNMDADNSFARVEIRINGDIILENSVYSKIYKFDLGPE